METPKHGTFCWNELATPDAEGAKKFYGEVFGWKFQSRDMGKMIYHMAEVDGKGDGRHHEGLCTGQPAMWGSYISVDNVDETAKLAAELGAKIVMGPHDIPEVGRMVVMLDPQGDRDQRHHADSPARRNSRKDLSAD